MKISEYKRLPHPFRSVAHDAWLAACNAIGPVLLDANANDYGHGVAKIYWGTDDGVCAVSIAITSDVWTLHTAIPGRPMYSDDIGEHVDLERLIARAVMWARGECGQATLRQEFLSALNDA